MHYPIYLFTDEFPTDEVISKAIAPFDQNSEETNPNPIISFDYCVLGGRYNGAIKLRCDDDDENYKWFQYLPTCRAGRLYRSYVMEALNKHCRFPESEETQYLSSFGRRDGFIYVDGCLVRDIANMDYVRTGSWGYIDAVSGQSSAREFWSVGKKEILNNPEYDRELQDTIAARMSGYITMLDFHS